MGSYKQEITNKIRKSFSWIHKIDRRRIKNSNITHKPGPREEVDQHISWYVHMLISSLPGDLPFPAGISGQRRIKYFKCKPNIRNKTRHLKDMWISCQFLEQPLFLSTRNVLIQTGMLLIKVKYVQGSECLLCWWHCYEIWFATLWHTWK